MLERNLPPRHPDVRREKSDARAGPLLAFGILLAVLGLIVQASAASLFDYLKEREYRKYPALPSLAAKDRTYLPRDLDKIPPPRLQESEPVDLARLRQMEDALLNNYGWVDREKGVVRIPIDEAMRLLAERASKERKK